MTNTIDIPSEPLAAYVPFAQVSRERWTGADLAVSFERARDKEVRALVASAHPAARVARASKKKPVTVWVVRGKLAGQAVSVFWVGTDRIAGGARFGATTSSGDTVWLSARDCSNEPAVETEDAFAREVIADALEAGDNARAAAIARGLRCQIPG